MTYMVKRAKDGRISWTGPIRSPGQAAKERDAWTGEGFIAEVVTSSPEVRAQVRAWEKDKAEERRQSNDPRHAG